MHRRSLSELQGDTTQWGASTPRTSQDGALWSSKLRRASSCFRCLPRGAPLWAWLLLGALVVPGAWSYLSEEQEEMLVELHNHYRGQVSPSASAMLPLKWDSSLKLLAEGYAAKCIWNHNPDLEDTGENLFAGTGPLDLRVALEKWFLEHLDYDFQNNSCDEDKMCGHYTQMVWAGTHRVGCALHICNSMDGLDWERVSFLVCNYYPAGNYEDERPYVEGDWCSRCPENLQKCENNLCAPDTVEEDIEDEEEEAGEEEVTDDPSIQPPGTNLPGTVDPTDQPATADSAPSITTTLFGRFSKDTPSTTTPAEVTQAPSVTKGKDEEIKDSVEDKDEEEVEPEKRKETTVRKAAERETGVTRKIHEDTKASRDAASASSPSVLLACLTVMLTLRL